MGSNLSHNSIFKEQPVFPPGKAFPFKGQKTREPILTSSATQIFKSLRAKGYFLNANCQQFFVTVFAASF